VEFESMQEKLKEFLEQSAEVYVGVTVPRADFPEGGRRGDLV